MEEKTKGFSLRQKKSSRRPPISAPKQILNTPTPLPTPLGNGNDKYTGTVQGGRSEKSEQIRQRPRPGGHTSDLVKRRYSTRFTTLGDFTNADAPPIPSLPSGDLKQPVQPKYQTDLAQSPKIDVDLAVLRDTELEAEKCKAADLGLSISFLINENEQMPRISSQTHRARNYVLTSRVFAR